MGQIVECKSSSVWNSNTPCEPKSWCKTLENTNKVYANPCTDLIFFGNALLKTDSAGVYSLYHSLWNKRPVYWNEVKNKVIVFDITRSRWTIISTEFYEQGARTSASIPDNYAIHYNNDPDVTAGWPDALVFRMTTSRFGIYCPGSAHTFTSSSGNYQVYPEPFLRMCAPGHYCQTTKTQVKCEDLRVYIHLELLWGVIMV